MSTHNIAIRHLKPNSLIKKYNILIKKKNWDFLNYSFSSNFYRELFSNKICKNSNM